MEKINPKTRVGWNCGRILDETGLGQQITALGQQITEQTAATEGI